MGCYGGYPNKNCLDFVYFKGKQPNFSYISQVGNYTFKIKFCENAISTKLKPD